MRLTPDCVTPEEALARLRKTLDDATDYLARDPERRDRIRRNLGLEPADTKANQ